MTIYHKSYKTLLFSLYQIYPLVTVSEINFIHTCIAKLSDDELLLFPPYTLPKTLSFRRRSISSEHQHLYALAYTWFISFPLNVYKKTFSLRVLICVHDIQRLLSRVCKRQQVDMRNMLYELHDSGNKMQEYAYLILLFKIYCFDQKGRETIFLDNPQGRYTTPLHQLDIWIARHIA
jgi:hypothetical protein